MHFTTVLKKQKTKRWRHSAVKLLSSDNSESRPTLPLCHSKKAHKKQSNYKNINVSRKVFYVLMWANVKHINHLQRLKHLKHIKHVRNFAEIYNWTDIGSKLLGIRLGDKSLLINWTAFKCWMEYWTCFALLPQIFH